MPLLLQPQLSIYTYIDPQRYMDGFRSASQLPPPFTNHIASLQMNYKPCVFSSLKSRDTWVAGGVIFVNVSVIADADEVLSCVEAGLDTISGFPGRTPSEYQSLPTGDVRREIVRAINRCSEQGNQPGESEERTKDGLTPLPLIGCVLARIGE